MIDLLRIDNIEDDTERLLKAIEIFEPHLEALRFIHLKVYLPSLRGWTQEHRESIIGTLVANKKITYNDNVLRMR